MKKKFQRILVIVLAIALILTVLLPALTLLAGAKEVTKEDINNIKGTLTDISAEKKAVQQQAVL